MWAALTWTIIANDTGLRITVVDTAGTEESMHLLQKKRADMANYDAALVKRDFKDKHDLRTIFPFAPAVWQFAVAKDANIKSLKDLDQGPGVSRAAREARQDAGTSIPRGARAGSAQPGGLRGAGPPARADPASRGTPDRLRGPKRMYQNVLEGVRIVDFSWVVAGPFCTKLLALMGADVIKVESARRAQYKDRGAWFSVLNNSKKSCTINLSTDQGKALVRKLIAMSDVVVENFSTGVMERLGLGYEPLRAIKGDLIYVSSSGVGRTGPGRNWLAYGSLLQGLSGWTSLFSPPNPKVEGRGSRRAGRTRSAGCGRP